MSILAISEHSPCLDLMVQVLRSHQILFQIAANLCSKGLVLPFDEFSFVSWSGVFAVRLWDATCHFPGEPKFVCIQMESYIGEF